MLVPSEESDACLDTPNTRMLLCAMGAPAPAATFRLAVLLLWSIVACQHGRSEEIARDFAGADGDAESYSEEKSLCMSLELPNVRVFDIDSSPEGRLAVVGVVDALESGRNAGDSPSLYLSHVLEGEVLWQRSIGLAGDGEVINAKVAASSDTSCVVLYLKGALDLGSSRFGAPGQNSTLLMWLDPVGALGYVLHVLQPGEAGYPPFIAVESDHAGGCMVAVSHTTSLLDDDQSTGGGSIYELHLARFNPTGEVQWIVYLGAPSILGGLASNGDDEFVVVGFVNGSSSTPDIPGLEWNNTLGPYIYAVSRVGLDGTHKSTIAVSGIEPPRLGVNGSGDILLGGMLFDLPEPCSQSRSECPFKEAPQVAMIGEDDSCGWSWALEGVHSADWIQSLSGAADDRFAVAGTILGNRHVSVCGEFLAANGAQTESALVILKNGVEVGDPIRNVGAFCGQLGDEFETVTENADVEWIANGRIAVASRGYGNNGALVNSWIHELQLVE